MSQGNKQKEEAGILAFIERHEKPVISLFAAWPIWAVISFILMVISGYLGFPQVVLELPVVICIAAVSVLMSVIWVYDYVPHRISIALHRGAPLVGMIVLIVMIGLTSLNTFETVRVYLIDMGIDYSESLVISISMVEVAALSILFKGLLTRDVRQNANRNLASDMQSVISLKLGLEPHELFKRRRYARTSPWNHLECSRTSTELQVEIWGSVLVVLVAFLIHLRLMFLAALLPEMLADSAGLILLILILVPTLPRLLAALIGYRLSRKIWRTYWDLVRQMMFEGNRLPDELRPIGYTLLAVFLYLEDPSMYVYEAERHAERYSIPFDDEDDFELIAYINWFHRTYQTTKSIKTSIYEDFPVLSDIKNRIESLRGRKFPHDEFPGLLKDSLLLEGAVIADRWPELFKSITAIYELKDVDSALKSEVLKIASEQREWILRSSSVPLSGALKLLSGFFVASVTLLPYFISFVYLIIG